MILIYQDHLSSNPTHLEVIDWLHYYGSDFKVVCGNDFYEQGDSWKFKLSSNSEHLSSEAVDFTDVKSIWFRGFLRYRNFMLEKIEDLVDTNDNISELKIRTLNEVRIINSHIFKTLSDKKWIPKIESIRVDKISVLKHARKCGLSIPDSIITNSKKELQEFHKLHKKVITKPLYETIYFYDKSKVCFFKTDLLKSKDLKNLPDLFFPSLFQGYVEKDIELRIFYLDGDFYSMAIFSQLDPKTSIDFRNYNDEKPNRNVPFALPSNIKMQLNSTLLS